jgi:hypothetical protein
MDSTSVSATSSDRGRHARGGRRGVLAACIALAGVALLRPLAAAADDVYQEPAAFVAGAFDGQPPPPSKLWVKAELNERVRAILGTTLPALRQKYWRDDERTVWILEAIGRDRPITAGFVVAHGAIVRAAILVYRESRGDEVRHPFFIDQFKGAALKDDGGLDKHIDGITGATLSVRAVSGLAQVALLLDHEARTIKE